ncbi:DUF58 domain-containing protein [Compostibacter hankyongensis]|uniref:DUF58 domain-containing protein n=1 Tax=Compostibacter hankyongensis TaxID=1007089 RepID=A0ABP8FFQ7_9BACT
MPFKKYIAPLYFTPVFYAAGAVVAVCFVLRFFLRWPGDLPFLLLGLFFLLTAMDYLLLFGRGGSIFARRIAPERLSNGDENDILIYVKSRYRFRVRLTVIDEVPFQFRKRDTEFTLSVLPGREQHIRYGLRPVRRGAYEFGKINVYARSRLGWIERRYRFETPLTVPVYPGFLQMRRYQLLALANRLSEAGIRRLRRVGHSPEFEHIKEYVQGDDMRTVNWKATARRGGLMVNHYTEEKSQQIYCIIDKGRVMKMPFNGMSLLDYAINAALVLSNVALLKQDKAGLITFSEAPGTFLKADARAVQMSAILELLYNQKTRYLESDYEKLYQLLRARVTHRSLLVLFTNFETLTALQRQLPYLRRIARHHLLLVVIFENTELRKIREAPARDLEAVYTQTIAEQFAHEKQRILKELRQYGILALLTAPEQVTVSTVNRYLEVKSRGEL